MVGCGGMVLAVVVVLGALGTIGLGLGGGLRKGVVCGGDTWVVPLPINTAASEVWFLIHLQPLFLFTLTICGFLGLQWISNR